MNATEAAKATLILKLSLHQQSTGLNDRDFAESLGISRQLLQFTRQGTREIGLTLLMAITQHIPGLIPEVIEYLRNGSTDAE